MKIRWTRRALADLKRITERIAKDKPAVAAEFVQSVSEKAGLLGEFPLLGRIGAYQDTRELVEIGRAHD